MNLSIIIPTFNRCIDLEACLISIERQEINNLQIEIIVADNNSTDQTSTVVNQFKSRINNLKYTKVAKPGLHEGRHAGMFLAKSDWLVFIDDDVLLPSNWCNEILKTIYSYPDIKLIASKVLPVFESEPPLMISNKWASDKMIIELSIIDPGDESCMINPFYVFGCSFIVRKDFLIEVGGFHPDGMPWHLTKFRGDGESHISEQLFKRGEKAFYNPQIVTYHKVSAERMSDRYFQKRNYLQGVSDAYTAIRKRYFGEKEEIQYPRIKKSLLVINNLIKYLPSIIKCKLNKGNVKDYYNNGFYFLTNQFYNNSEVFAWVLKKNYLNK